MTLLYLGGGLWLIPLLCLLASGWFFYKGRTSSTHYYAYSVVLAVAAIVTFLLMRSDR